MYVLITGQDLSSDHASCSRYLSPGVIETANTFDSPRKKNFLNKRLLMSVFLHSHGLLGEPLDVISGKDRCPKFMNTDCSGSLSDSAEFSACAIAATPVGIDIEKVKARNRMQEIMERLFSAGEIDYVNGSDDPTLAFTRLWTVREAALKAVGCGIAGLHKISVDMGERAIFMEQSLDHGGVLSGDYRMFSVLAIRDGAAVCISYCTDETERLLMSYEGTAFVPLDGCSGEMEFRLLGRADQ